MKYLVWSLAFLVSHNLWAQSRSCDMTSGGNSTPIKILSSASGVLVQLTEEEEPDQCQMESTNEFDLLVRCGSGDDATFFGVKGSTGRVYEKSGTIAQLKRCKRI